MIFFLGACSSKNAFYYFDMDEAQQLSAQSFKRVKLMDSQELSGTFSSIYLNEVYPDRFNGDEYFLVYVYFKDEPEHYEVKLNGKSGIKIKELDYKNRFSNISREMSKWSKYYLVSFEEQESALSLELYMNNSKKASVRYVKNKD
jgi:hypothetical protein